MAKFKQFFMIIFFISLIVLFGYGYIQVYTSSYNITHREKIEGLEITYDDKTVHITLCGKNFDIII